MYKDLLQLKTEDNYERLETFPSDHYRKSPLYDNCFLHAPDGQPLCTCDKKKAKWYLDKGIGGTLDNNVISTY